MNATRCLAMLLPALLTTAPLAAQRIENLSQGEAMRAAFTTVVERANRSVVEFTVDGELSVLGTVVAPDLVVTKLSELPPASEQKLLVCRQGQQSWTGTRVGFDRPSDLLLVRLAEAKLPPIVWQTVVPAAGALLASPDGHGAPLGTGVLSCGVYVHTRPRPFLGVRFADPSGTTAEVGEAIAHGAANAGGLRAGDVVVRFGEHDIGDPNDLRARIMSRKPGDKVAVAVQRGDEELQFEVTLGVNTTAPSSGQENIWGDLSTVRSGFAAVLQHDTILRPDDCGGPVVDLSGKALGVNISRAGRIETLALPAAKVQELVAKMLAAAKQPAATGH